MIAAHTHSLSTLVVLQMFFRHIWFNIKTLLAHGTIGCKIRLCDTAKHFNFNFNLILNKNAMRRIQNHAPLEFGLDVAKLFPFTRNQSIANFSISKTSCVRFFPSCSMCPVLMTGGEILDKKEDAQRRYAARFLSLSFTFAHFCFLFLHSLFSLYLSRKW